MPSNPVTSGLMLQLDARTLSNTDGSSQSTWTAVTGSNATVPSGCIAPIYKVNIFGTSPAIRFGGAANTGLSGTIGSSPAWGTGGAGWTAIFALANAAASISFAGAFSLGRASQNDQSDTGGMAIASSGTTGFYSIDADSKSLVDASIAGESALPMPTQPSVFSFGTNGTTHVVGLNGLVTRKASPFTFTPTNPSNYILGQRWQSGAVGTTFGGILDLCLVCIYNLLLSDSDNQKVMQWMETELGMITSSSGGGLLVPPSMMGASE